MNRHNVVIFSAILGAVAGSATSVVTTVVVAAIWPNVQRVEIVPAQGDANGAQFSAKPYLMYSIYQAHVDGNKGFLGIGQTQPLWYFRVAVFNNTGTAISGVYVSSEPADGMVPLRFIAGVKIRSMPDGPDVGEVDNQNRDRKLAAYIASIPPNMCYYLTLVVEAPSIPVVDQLHLLASSDQGSFAIASKGLWDGFRWQ